MRYLISIVALIAGLGILAGVKGAQISTLMAAGAEMQKAGPPPEAVSTAKAEEQAWQESISAIASVVSVKGVALSNDAPGTVSRLHLESGAPVKQGQVLVELDSKVERAQLASLRARRAHAELSLKRSEALALSGAVAKSQLDADRSAFESLTADARALEAQIERKIVRAPFSGRLGMREVNLGQYLAPGTRVSVLESTEALYVDFTLPQRHVSTVRVGMPVHARLESTNGAPAEGTISAIEPALDAVTRAVKVRASFATQDDRLRPGMFVNVSVLLPNSPRVVAVPQTAVVHASFGDSVFIVESKPGPGGKPLLSARQQFVRLGTTQGDFVAVLDGVTAGQEVVTAGAFKLRNGAPVAVNDAVKLDPQLAPRPVNR